MSNLHVSLNLLLGSDVLLGAAVLTPPVVLLAGPVSRRFGVSKVLAGAAFVAALGVFLITSPINGPQTLAAAPTTWSGTRGIAWLSRGWTDLRLVDLGLEGWANVLLYFPASLLWTLVTRRPLFVTLIAVMASGCIEGLQGALAFRVADPRDLYANALGALIGAAAGAVILRGPRNYSAAQRRQFAVALVVAVCLAGLCEYGLGAVADNEQDALLQKVRQAYSTTTAKDVTAAGARGEYLSFASKPGVPADYLGAIGTDIIQARFSIKSAARPRCVIVTWRNAMRPADFHEATGSLCRGFKDVGLPVVSAQ